MHPTRRLKLSAAITAGRAPEKADRPEGQSRDFDIAGGRSDLRGARAVPIEEVADLAS
jgi:hypothetical protein